MISILPPSDPSFLAKLEYLDMGDNQLCTIPVELARLPSLKTLKCVNNLIEIIPAEICEMDLRVLDVASNPLMMPPVETCQRGLQSMRRYYHCLKLEETGGPALSQSPPHESIIKKKKNEKSRMTIKKLKDSTKKAFPSSLTRPSMFRTSSEHASSGHSAPLPASLSLEQSSFDHGSRISPFVSRAVSMSDAKVRSPTNEESFDGDTNVVVEYASNEKPTGLEKAENVRDNITVNDTLKVIFVGMALSGKTSIIKRLIEGKDAKIPQKDERTIGVDIYEWDPKSTVGICGRSLMTQIPVDKELESRLKRSVDVKFSVWDFAGQHVYHVRHNIIAPSLQSVFS